MNPAPRAHTGVSGLDDVLAGGLPAHQLYLVDGDPGSGKTTLALQFLMEGARRRETGLYVTLSETKAELLAGRPRTGGPSIRTTWRSSSWSAASRNSPPIRS